MTIFHQRSKERLTYSLQWTVHKVGKDTYQLSVGGYRYVGVEGGKVVASIHKEHETLWVVTRREYQNAFT